jgi:hypothetical protein
MSAGARRVGLALLAHAALLALWPIVRPLYAPLARKAAELALEVVAPWPGPFDVRLVAGANATLAEDLIAADTTVRVQHRELKGAGTFGASTFFHGWLPTSALLALFAAATPLEWRRRLRPLVLALLLLHLFLLARLVVAVFANLAESSAEGRPFFELSGEGARALRMARHFAWAEMFTSYLAPLAIWSLCVFDRRPRAE